MDSSIPDPAPPPPCADWEVLAHPSDLRVRVRGDDLRALFRNAARSVFALSAAPRASWPDALETIEVAVEGDDDLTLLHDLLAECVYCLETKGFLAQEVLIDQLGPHLARRECRARLIGARFAADELDVVHVIKAVTWHGLAIQDEGGARRGLCAEILHDL